MRELLANTIKAPVDRFLAIDGAGLFVANVEVGSHRYRVTFSGPGGHSYARFGTANPIQAMGRAIARISQIRVPSQPRTTFNVGRVGGGTAVNAIPIECWMEIDLRSSSVPALAALDAEFRKSSGRRRQGRERSIGQRSRCGCKSGTGRRPGRGTNAGNGADCPHRAPVARTLDSPCR